MRGCEGCPARMQVCRLSWTVEEVRAWRTTRGQRTPRTIQSGDSSQRGAAGRKSRRPCDCSVAGCPESDVDEDRSPRTLSPSSSSSQLARPHIISQPVQRRRDSECDSLHPQHSQCLSNLRQATCLADPHSSGRLTPAGIRRSRISWDAQARPTPTSYRRAAPPAFLHQSTVLQSAASSAASTFYLCTHSLLPPVREKHSFIASGTSKECSKGLIPVWRRRNGQDHAYGSVLSLSPTVGHS